MFCAGRKGVGKAILPIIEQEEILIYEVPKIRARTKSNHIDHYHDYTKERKTNVITNNDNNALLLKHDKIDTFETFPLDSNVTKTVCQNGFCCEFAIGIVAIDSSTKYRLAVFNGIRLYGDVKAGVQACSVIQCLNNSISSCGSTQNSKTIFSNIGITATFHDYKNLLIMPSTLNSKLLTLTNWTYDEHTHDDHVHINMLLDNSMDNIVTFGVYSIHFNKNKASNMSFNTVSYFVVLLMTLLLMKL